MMRSNSVTAKAYGSSRRSGLHGIPLTATCVAALLSCGVALAQNSASGADADADSGAVETVVVSGYRHSLESTVVAKQGAVGVVEAVSSMELGKLPDVSIAESLSRLPGLAGQRVAGRTQVVAIRGMSPDFAGTTLNGREQVSTGDNRGVEFDQYPAELLAGAVVYKTPDAKLLGQGLSGTIDLHTVRPLDYDERQLSIGVRGEYNTQGDLTNQVSPWGNRFNIAYVDQFFGGKLGVAIGFAHLDSPTQEKTYEAWWWANCDDWGQAQDGKDSDAETLQGAQAYLYGRDQVRDGIMGAIEFQPNEHFHSIIDLYYSNFNQKEHVVGIQWTDDPYTLIDGGYAGYNSANYTTVGSTKLVTSGSWYGIRPEVKNEYNTRNDVLQAAGWRNEVTYGDFEGALDLSVSRAKRNEVTTEVQAGATDAETDFGFSIYAKPKDFPTFSSSTDFSDTSVIGIYDPQGYGRDGRVETPRQVDTIQAIRLEGKYNIKNRVLESIETGIGFSVRQKKKTSSVYYLYVKDAVTDATDYDNSIYDSSENWRELDSQYLHSAASFSYVGLGNVLTMDVPAVVENYLTKELVMSADDYKKDFSVKEKVATYYLMFNVDSDLGFATLKGNIGAQLIHTDQYSSAFDIDGSSEELVGNLGSGKSYNDFLPSINLTMDFDNGNLVRIGLAKTMARPRIDDLRAAASASVSDTSPYEWSGSGGNPQLSPWRADSIDISFEHYFGTGSYVAIAGFYKNLRTYIYEQTITNYDFSDYTNTSAHTPSSNYGSYTTPANGKGGYMRGMEVSATLEGSLFSKHLEGFGTVLSFSWTDTSIHSDGPDSSEVNTLPGLSKAVGSATVYYEKDGWSFRVSERYRSDYRGEITTLFAQRSYTRILAEATTDLQFGYEFQDGPYKGLSAVIEVENLTDTPYRTVQTSSTSSLADMPLDYETYGRQIVFGFSYKL